MIKSDRWIRRMAAGHRMIEPFEPGQVRTADGRRIVSYGTSSYGYDIRCSTEFKIFTNINSTIVDPKAFDEKSFVDFTGDVCIIPPNSFALARTVEYFRIPRSVLTVCLGKCVTGDTRVVDADTGAYMPITEMAGGRRTLALDGGHLRPALVAELVPQGRKPVFELRTRTGLRIRATANHPFRRRHGWTALASLKAGDPIAVAGHVPVFGRTPIPDWEASLLGLMMSAEPGDTPDDTPRCTPADPALGALLQRSMTAGGFGVITGREKPDGGRLADHAQACGMGPSSLVARWLQAHGLRVGAAEKSVPQSIFMAPAAPVRLFLQALFSGDGGSCRGDRAPCLEYRSASRRLVEDVHHLLLRFGISSLLCEATSVNGMRAGAVRVSGGEPIARFADRIGFCPGSVRQVRLQEEILPALAVHPTRIESCLDTLPREASTLLGLAMRAAGTRAGRPEVRFAGGHAVALAAAAHAAHGAPAEGMRERLDGPVWDIVESIAPAGHEDVYDIVVPGPANFVANGIVVHNSTYARCGIIVNVTPLEPEWEGHVTLEFSNTTPLPAKIYANEGVAQVIFFESDEVCETSYKDRGGKYQGQQGVTLPKT